MSYRKTRAGYILIGNYATAEQREVMAAVWEENRESLMEWWGKVAPGSVPWACWAFDRTPENEPKLAELDEAKMRLLLYGEGAFKTEGAISDNGNQAKNDG